MQIRKLEETLNYQNDPGNHTRLSPVVGARATEIEEITNAIKQYPILKEYEKGIYETRNTYIIPKEQKDMANLIAKQIFIEYIKKYEKDGVTEKNAVKWRTADLSPFSNKTLVSDIENERNTWNITAFVDTENEEKYGCYLPPHVVAYHELMHVEEAVKGKPASIANKPSLGYEILTATKTIILLDYIYKRINNLELNLVVDYKIDINIAGKKIPLGYFANFYRNLEKKENSLSKAILSQESLYYLSKDATIEKVKLNSASGIARQSFITSSISSSIESPSGENKPLQISLGELEIIFSKKTNGDGSLKITDNKNINNGMTIDKENVTNISRCLKEKNINKLISTLETWGETGEEIAKELKKHTPKQKQSLAYLSEDVTIVKAKSSSGIAPQSAFITSSISSSIESSSGENKPLQISLGELEIIFSKKTNGDGSLKITDNKNINNGMTIDKEKIADISICLKEKNINKLISILETWGKTGEEIAKELKKHTPKQKI